MLLVFMSVIGALFPAVDLTAGEKERRCAETTMLLPIPMTAVHLEDLRGARLGDDRDDPQPRGLALSAGHLIDQFPRPPTDRSRWSCRSARC